MICYCSVIISFMLQALGRLQLGNRFNKIGCTLQEFRRVETHYRCRSKFYPGTKDTVERLLVKDDEIKWSSNVSNPPYNPPSYTAQVVLDGPEWADPDIDSLWFHKKPRWNLNDGQTYSRQCGSHIYAVNNSVPLNPIGKTGIRGRGLLGRWGPNHAVHLILARWKRLPTTDFIMINKHSGKKEIDVVSVLRDDVRLWALPGKFLTKGERVETALKRCFISECMDNLKTYCSERDRRFIVRKLNSLFSNMQLIYRGYVDDPRNTDNAWVSSTVMLIFDKDDNVTKHLILQPGASNILDINWISSKRISLIDFFAGHGDFVKDVATMMDAHFSIPVELTTCDPDESILSRITTENAD